MKFGEWRLSEACTPSALNESIPIVKLKPPLCSTVTTHHIPGFVITKPLEFLLPAMLAYRLAGLAHDAE